MLSLLLEIAGMAAIVTAAFMVTPALGVLALGLSLGTLGYLLEDDI